MARTRHKPNSTATKSAAQREREHLQRVRYLSKSGQRVDPTNISATQRAAATLRARERLERGYSHKVTKAQAAVLKERGFHVSKRGVAVDAPRDAKRQRIPGAKMAVTKSGTVVWRVKDRTDYIAGMTKAEKKSFVKDRTSFIESVIARLRRENPSLRNVPRKKIQVRLQWGAFQATKDFSPYYFTKTYFGTVSPEDARRGSKKKRADKLTGIHLVIHKPRKKSNVTRRKRK